MLRKLFFAGALVAGSLGAANAQNAPSWLRYSSISPDGQTIVFTYKGDLFRVPASGGTAIPLTAHEAHDFMPVWSKDGKTIVFASDRYGNFDLFQMPATGGEAQRMTFHSSNEYPYEISPDNKTVYFGSTRLDMASNRQFPTFAQPELYKVALAGGRVQQVLTTPAEEVKLSKDGQVILYQDKKGGENQWRKHHVSSVARDLWRYDTKTGQHTKLTTYAGEDRTPVFANNDKTIYYLSEESGSFNVHRMAADKPGPSTQLTKFTKHPVRFLTAANNGVLCFGFDGDVYTMQPNGTPQKVNIVLATEGRTNNERIVPVAGAGVQDLAVSPNGKEIAFIYRGEVFVSAVEGTATKRITNTPEQERSVSFSPDGKTLLYSSERGKGWKIYQTQMEREGEPYFYASTLLKETALIDNDKENYQPQFSPDGKEVGFVEDRMTLKVYNLKDKKVRTLLTTNELFSMRDNDLYFTWSPDSKWISFEFSEPGYWNGEVGIISADGKGKKINLTESGYQDSEPQWMLNGKMLIWQSTREGMRSQANSGGAQSDVFAMFLTQDAYDKFRLSKEDYALIKEQEEKAAKEKEKDKKKKKEDEALPIDWEGLKTRKARLTLHSSNLADALVSKDGETLYYLARFEKGFNLWSTNLRTKETKMAVTLNANRASMEWDKDLKNIFLLADGRVIKLDPAANKQENVAISGDMNLNVAAERAFMLEHVWRRTQKTFYTAGFHGAKWEELKPDYEKYLPHISNNYEFTELLSELLGELNVSHSGASFSNVPANADATASLGVFYDQNFTGNGLKIDEVLLEGPLQKAGLDVTAGMIIEKIDGETLTPEKDYAQFMNRKAGKNVLLTVFDPKFKKRREITVKPISAGEENALLYKRWVRRNAEEVDRLSNGQLGYVHIPNMSDPSYRTVYEEVMGKYANRKGMVVDSRNNAGGDLVADLAMFLSGKMFLSYTTDNRSVGMEPSFRWNKPSIALANEANYSDGHCFAFSYQDLKLGKLVGMPVPGTCTFAGWESLQDNSIRWGVPPLGVKDVQNRYLENLQTEPDVKVMNEYHLVSKGKDQQLEVAVQELLKEIK
ncbi:S41 family peptidase [Rufibacter glacialis]|uniref:Tricorn protease homolog n=1 Tax=Rufibacter glacialis TaxID=1259555 RepID=A0A5M8Q953_9BACT|nr:S41 family peptidase [Rufibacter glacialis]KAA6432477.1 peptidase S41 [Rufibacter glacialis]GGK78994.1 tricorn protease [Rufibacter glacialis]